MAKRKRKRSKKSTGKYFQLDNKFQEIVDNATQMPSKEVQALIRQLRKASEVLVNLLKAREKFLKEGEQDEDQNEEHASLSSSSSSS